MATKSFCVARRLLMRRTFGKRWNFFQIIMVHPKRIILSAFLPQQSPKAVWRPIRHFDGSLTVELTKHHVLEGQRCRREDQRVSFDGEPALKIAHYY